MTLRDAINDIRHRRLGAISEGFFAPRTHMSVPLARLSHLEERVVLPQTSRMHEVTKRVDACLELHTVGMLDQRDWSVVPWIMWQGKNAGDNDWFLDALFHVISSKRPPSVIRALTQSYVAFFDPNRWSCARVAAFLKGQGLSPSAAFGRRWLTIDERFSIFDPRQAPQQLSSHVLESETWQLALRDVGISADRASDGLGRFAFRCAIEAVSRKCIIGADEADIQRAVQRVLDWNTIPPQNPRYVDDLPWMATMLLESISAGKVPETIQDTIVRHFVAMLGDPRLSEARWRDVSEKARDIAFRVLIQATLDDFFNIIDATAEGRHWSDRKRFWLEYHKAGAMTGAWVAFGPKAIARAGHLEKAYGKLVSLAEKNQSALIMQIGGATIVELSHNGTCRCFWNHDTAPKLYDRTYDAQRIYYKCDMALRHNGSWQPKFTYEIYHHTGIRHTRWGSGWR